MSNIKKMSKKVSISLLAVLALSSQSFAGGDMLPVTAYETEDSLKSALVEVEKPAIATPTLVEKSPWYLGAGLVAGRVSDANCEDITYGIMAKVGYEINENVAVEARGIRTNWEYEGAKIKHVGVFVKPQYPVTEEVNLYGLVGYAKTTTAEKKIINEKGLAYGAGVAYALSEDTNLFVDYERLIQKSSIPDVDALSFGLSFSL